MAEMNDNMPSGTLSDIASDKTSSKPLDGGIGDCTIYMASVALTTDGYQLYSADTHVNDLLLNFDGIVELNQANNKGAEQQQQQQHDTILAGIHGVVGILALELHKYLVVITDSHCKGEIAGCKVYEVTGISLLPLDYSLGEKELQKLIQQRCGNPGPKSDKANKSGSNTEDMTPSGSIINESIDVGRGNGEIPVYSEDSNVNMSRNPISPKINRASRLITDGTFSWLPPQINKLLNREQPKKSSTEDSAGNSPSETPTDVTESLKSEPLTPELDQSTATPEAINDGQSTHVELLDDQKLASNSSNGNGKHDQSIQRMESRIIEEIKRVFSTSGMFYSYNYDLTRSMQEKSGKPEMPTGTSLVDSANPDYWFNKHLQTHIIQSGAKEWALPLIQGCVQIAKCEIEDGNSFQICVLSRRNCSRIGLRYERRGIDSNGNVANFVETEQILTVVSDGGQTHYVCFVQTRGSIPLYWKQVPNGLHPPPVALRSDKENIEVCSKHLNREIDRLGRQIIVNLVEHKGREAIVGSKYADIVGECVADESIDPSKIRYIPWDFHYETRGMKFENLDQLMVQLGRELGDMGYFWQASGNLFTKQSGAFRVNCMDCLDRTNVVQSTFARAVLNEQLIRMGVHIAPEKGLDAYGELNKVLNHLWANNGDYISRQYAGTSAMKGDFTRTGKRNFVGVMNDASYSITRLWLSTFRDYFSQSVLDFVVGNQPASEVFRTLVDLKSRDPESSTRLSQERQAAIETAVSIVVEDDELVCTALIVYTPMTLNTKRLRKQIDAVLVLTDAAVYLCEYHYQMEKVTEFLRIELSQLVCVQYGAYITDTVGPQATDPTHNHGIILYFSKATTRFNSGDTQNKAEIGEDTQAANGSRPSKDASGTGSVVSDPSLSIVDIDLADDGNNNSESSLEDETEEAPADKEGADKDPSTAINFVCCKVANSPQVVVQGLARTTKSHDNPQNPDTNSDSRAAHQFERLKSLEDQLPSHIAEYFCTMVQSTKAKPADPSSAIPASFVVERDIIGLPEAKRNVGVMAKVSNSIHKALWI